MGESLRIPQDKAPDRDRQTLEDRQKGCVIERVRASLWWQRMPLLMPPPPAGSGDDSYSPEPDGTHDDLADMREFCLNVTTEKWKQ